MRIIWHYVNGWDKAGHTLIQVDFLFGVRREQGLRPDQIRFVGRRGSGATPVGRANGHLSQQSTRTSLQLGLWLAQLCPHHLQVSPFKSPPGQLPSPQLQGHGGFQEDFLSRQDTAILSGTYTHKISEFSNSFLMNSSSCKLNLLILTFCHTCVFIIEFLERLRVGSFDTIVHYAPWNTSALSVYCWVWITNTHNVFRISCGIFGSLANLAFYPLM